ncbi:class III signal peptide-containing protein [Methanocaldococcus bathoardescens]|uniref:class III signal peptide-containing protein n=1 Tax=Methanocaldococcus bathoardescens TaxID=1301915 RepID=UPI0009DD267C|nr:class III signal peptide-containing protein [Methanocaldococcus bathoardescens]
MKLLKKLMSNKGQLSMEVGVLVAAAVLVAIIAGYYYVKNAGTAAKTAGKQAENFTKTLNETANDYTEELQTVTNNLGPE